MCLSYRSSELSAAKSSILTAELESCQQLHELEPDNKCKSAQAKGHDLEQVIHKMQNSGLLYWVTCVFALYVCNG